MKWMHSIGSNEQVVATLEEVPRGSGNNDFLALDFALGLGLGSTWQ